ncbi:hypothetical protein D3C72_2388000 [compost metagenome]
MLIAQATAGEQQCECVVHVQLAADGRGLAALDEATVDGDGQASHFAELTQ